MCSIIAMFALLSVIFTFFPQLLHIARSYYSNKNIVGVILPSTWYAENWKENHSHCYNKINWIIYTIINFHELIRESRSQGNKQA